jgi:hypothetical protein
MTAKTKTIKKTTARPRLRKLNRSTKKKVVRTTGRVPNSFILFAHALNHLWRHKKIFGSILLIYFLLYFVFVKGLATSFQLNETRELLDNSLGDQLGGVATASALFGALLGTAGSTAGEAASVYQLALLVLFSLVIVWTLRQTYEKSKTIKLSDAFYKSSYPMVPYLLVGLVLLLQMIPMLLAISIYGVVVANGIAVGMIEQILWLCACTVGVGVSVYFLSSSIFASYIVTLPDMTPRRALRSARQLVRFRRWSLIRKILFLPVILLLVIAVIFLPLVLYVPVIAEVLFLVVSLSLVFVMHSYFYVLYRELL